MLAARRLCSALRVQTAIFSCWSAEAQLPMARPGFFDWLFVELKHLLQGISLTLKQLEGIGIGFPG